jgi:hypothetical protein
MTKFSAIAAVPLFLAASVASAAQPVVLDDGQMDRLTAGFSAVAEALAAGLGRVVTTETLAFGELANVAKSPVGGESGFEAGLTLVRSTALSASATATTTLPLIPIPAP